jgi:hypothetical protein
MRRLIVTIGLLAVLLSACGAPAPAPTDLPTEPPSLAETPAPLPTDTETPVPTPTITPTVPSSTPAPTATETLLPPLDLPTLAANPPALAVWDGLPTYLSDSQPGYDFRVRYDPEVWALTTDQFGQPALGHRLIPYCLIIPAAGHGLPPTVRVDHDMLYAGDLTFEVGKAYENGELTFITYQVSDGTIFTGFEVDFQEQSETCNNDAVTVLSTFQSVPASQATPPVTSQP